MKFDSALTLQAELRASCWPELAQSRPPGAVTARGFAPLLIGVGIAGTRQSAQLAVRVFSRRENADARRAREFLSKKAKGEIDYQVVGPVRTQAARNPRSSSQTLRPGAPICTSDHTMGTLGYFVQSSRGASEQWLILSNRHVLLPTRKTRIGNAVFHVTDRRLQMSDLPVVGRVARSHPLGDVMNEVDAAIATIDNSVALSLQFGDFKAITAHREDVDSSLGERVVKLGCITKRTVGVVTAVRMEVLGIEYPDEGVFRSFVEQIEIAPLMPGGHFSEPGDSGSLIVDEGGSASGLLFAGTSSVSSRTYANPMDRVLMMMTARFGVAGAV